KRDFGFWVMRGMFVLSAIYFSYQILGLMIRGKGLPVVDMLFFNPPETVNTLMKISFLFLLANIGAFNATIRREAALLLFAVNLISVAASLWLYFGFPVNPLFPADHQFLLTSIAGAGLVLALLIYLLIKLKPQKSEETANDSDLISPAATVLKWFFLFFGVLFTIYFLGIIYFRAFSDPDSGMGAVFGGPYPLVSNSITKYGSLAVFGYFLYRRADLRRFFTPVLIAGFAISVTATILYGLHGSTVVLNRNGKLVVLPYFMMMHVIVDGAGLVALIV